MERPRTVEEMAEALRLCGREGRSVRVVGGGTKRDWGAPVAVEVEVSTAGLDRIVVHNAGDLTAVVQAGAPLAGVNEEFRRAGQMLALDPADAGGATAGGVVATADSGPLRHRYLAPRDLVLGVTVALSDGTVAKSGGTVIKNVAGYDLAKLFTGSFGTLGAILQVAVRLHPLPRAPVTLVLAAPDRTAVASCAKELAARPLEAECLDVSWHGDRGAVVVRLAGIATVERAERVREVAARHGLEAGDADDDATWAEQRRAQRADGATVARVSLRPGRVAEVLELAARLGAPVVGRVAHGVFWLRLPGGLEDVVAAVEELRAAADSCVLLDAPEDVREKAGVWGSVEPRALEVMRSVKRRFDPAGVMAPGLFVGGI